MRNEGREEERRLGREGMEEAKERRRIEVSRSE